MTKTDYARMARSCIENLTQKELEELAQKCLEEAASKRLEKAQKDELIYRKHLDTLLELCPEHDRTSCSDEDPCNWGRVKCRRCLLIAVKRDRFNSCPDLSAFEISLQIKQRD